MATPCGIFGCIERKYFSRVEPSCAEKIATWAVVFFILSGAAFGLLHGFEVSQYALVTYFTGGISLIVFILSCVARSSAIKTPPPQKVPQPPPTAPFKPIPATPAPANPDENRDTLSPLLDLSDSKELSHSRASTKSETMMDKWFAGLTIEQKKNIPLDTEGVTYAMIQPQYNEIATLCLEISKQITNSTSTLLLPQKIASLCVDEINDHMTDFGRALILTGERILIIQKPPNAKTAEIEGKNLYCSVKKTEKGTIDIEEQGLIAAILMNLRSFLLKKD